MKESQQAIATQVRPDAQGLYDPVNEHDACGVGFVAISRAGRVMTS